MNRVFSGKVVHGDQYGRTLGFPTANLSYIDTDIQTGVYGGLAQIENGMQYKAAIVVIPNSDQNIQGYLLDFEGDLYGQEITFTLQHFLRPWMALPLDELKDQIKKDISQINNLVVI